MGGAEDQRRGPGRELAFDPLDVELALEQRHFGQLAADLLDDREEGVVDGRVDHDPVAGLCHRSQHLGQRRDDVAARRHLRRVDLPAEPRRGEPSEGFGQPQLGGRRVAAVVELDRFDQRSLHRRRQREVHLRHPSRQGLRVHRPLGAASAAQPLQRDLGQLLVQRRHRRPATLTGGGEMVC